MKKYGPKPLINVTNTDTIIGRQLKMINDIFRWYEIILVTGFQHEKVAITVPSKIKTVYNNDYLDTNVIHSIDLGLQERTTDNVIILYGDLIFNKFALNVPFNEESAAVISNTMKPEEIGCNIDNGYIEQMFYGIPNKWAQITFLQGYELHLLQQFVADPNHAECYGFEAINYIIEMKGKLKAIMPQRAKVIDIDTSLDLKRIETVI